MTKHSKFLVFLVIVTTINVNWLNAQSLFEEGQLFSGRFPQSVKLEDFNGDNIKDIVIVNDNYLGYNSLNANEIWINQGDGTFVFQSNFDNSQSQDVAVGDLDNDGDNDIFICSRSSTNVNERANKVWLNDGNGNFIDSGQLLGRNNSTSVVLRDFDNDNDLDALVGNTNINKLYLNNGFGVFTATTQNIGEDYTLHIDSKDIDNDGDYDLVTANFYSASNIVWLNDGSGYFTVDQTIGNINSNFVSIGHLNDDIFFDIIFCNTNGEVDIHINDGFGNFNTSSNLFSSTNENSKTTAIADIDLDGDNDIIVSFWSNTHNSRVLINNGDGSFSEDFLFNISNAIDVEVGDVNGDGFEDVFLLNTNVQDSELWINNTSELSTTNFSHENVLVYPNPTNNVINIKVRSFDVIMKIDLKDSLGRRIISKTSTTKLDLEQLSNGYYTISIQLQSGKVISKKILKL